ncbi:MAG TPA: acyltransferase family protein [Acidimicrobiales bacterium]|jgi:peptidoglycan/LPS O-acetylase OafA/YrhL|nr:acyltransferase family protein [Acidimicrobiales bacterium]
MSTDANARGARPSLGHIRGLDGIRALSVLAIIAFHTGLNSVPGGYYGVDAFFVLSGFLITSLLVKEWGSSGTIRLRRFWAGRARRLLPALFLLITVMGIVMAFVPSLLEAPHMLGYAIATVFYVSNWYSTHTSATYFSLSSGQSPLLHTWSLAIEEQFYLVWPLVVLAVLKLGRGRLYAWRYGGGQSGHAAPRRSWGRRARRERPIEILGGGTMVLKPAPAPASVDPEWERRRRLQVLFGVACFGSLASALAMVFFAPNGYTTRAYYGTDCRAQALLVGAAISIGLTLWPEGSHRRWFRTSAGVAGILGVAGTALLWTTVQENSVFAFSGGFLLASLAAGGVVLACAVAPRSIVVRLLELPPLPQWGRISYGMYLWYWPVLLVMTGQRLHWGVYPLFLARVGITVAIAALSYDLVEMPIRRGALRHWRSWVAAPIGAAVAISAVLISTLVPVGATELVGKPIDIQTAGAATAASTPTTQPVVPGQSTSSTVATSTTTTVPARTYLSLPLPPPSGQADKPVKVLIVGDSVAGTLGVGLADLANRSHYEVQFANEGSPGCSASMQEQIKVLWYTVPPNPPCSATNPDALFATWRKWVDAYNPDVVLYVARGETFDQEIGGTWQNLGEASFDDYVASRYREAVNALGSRGATVVLMTSPYYDSGDQAVGSPWPEDAPARVQIDNSTIHQVASASSTGAGTATDGKVYVFDLNQLVDPSGKYSPTIGPYNIRCNDGVHFSESGGEYVGLRLLPDLLALGQAHAFASPGGAWPGTMPPSTPSWFPNLPCQ